MAVSCRECSTSNEDFARHCANCGAALPRVCPSCAAINEVDARFVQGAGHASMMRRCLADAPLRNGCADFSHESFASVSLPPGPRRQASSDR